MQELQIVQTDEKDIQDAIILVVEHGIGSEDKEQVNGKYIAKIVANDWVFHYTTTENCEKVESLLRNMTC